ncbi:MULTISPECIES: cell division protein FtsL [Bacillus cereus group]|uniref:cell division protein FtsL n=1 Tax=Bacillus cereus group TaxID=86661 RepID=UPI000864216D|nr:MULTISPECIES: cell division protein FtsL [Bacillus cereus group]AWC29461.1 cell division protein FtsL [Bacillus cytotoxicus]AWC41592.1 cell division protein FtsL [Bacillus cytotoxicus]AWC49523.1 cell division protein FtsL [Bacillus cytotoxicus]AWC53536.1 cell division protein FtsL [Bacillus cytotoxicus]AWC57664.1 cell division protein FtsL [Bacillus cytotoxicus]
MSNLAVKYKQQTQEQVQSQAPQQMVQPKKAKITRIEKLLYMAFIGFLLYACVTFIGNKAGLYQVDREAAKIEDTIVKQQKENQELQAEVEKLSRYERIAKIAKKHGLEINANNVKGLH